MKERKKNVGVVVPGVVEKKMMFGGKRKKEIEK